MSHLAAVRAVFAMRVDRRSYVEWYLAARVTNCAALADASRRIHRVRDMNRESSGPVDSDWML